MGASQKFDVPRTAWKRIAILVLLVHLLLLFGLERLTGFLSADDAEAEPGQTLAVQMLALPVPASPRSAGWSC